MGLKIIIRSYKYSNNTNTCSNIGITIIISQINNKVQLRLHTNITIVLIDQVNNKIHTSPHTGITIIIIINSNYINIEDSPKP